MSEAEFVRLERRGDVALLRIDRPKVNALSSQLIAEIGEAVGRLSADLPGALVVWGGERVFGAGADINELRAAAPPVALSPALRVALDALAGLPRLTIAAINGVALGGSCELALACDVRIVATDSRLGQPEIQLGIIPGAGGTQRLARAVGSARAKELILTGRQVGAEEALAIGLAQSVVEPAGVLDAALELAATAARGAVVAQGLAKRAIDEGLSLTLDEGLDLERQLFEQAMATGDARIGLQSFIERGAGKARFAGR